MSPFVTAPIAKRLIDVYGVFNTFKILGIVFLVLLILLSLPFKFPKENIQTSSSDVASISPKEMLKDSRFYILWICFTIATFIGLMIIGKTSPVGEDVIKIDSRKIAFYVSIFSVFNGVGRPLFGYLSDKLKPKNVIMFSFCLVLIASILVIFFKQNTTVLYMISFILFWMNFGGWLSIAPTLTSKFFGPKYYSENYGILFTAYGVGAILGNLTSGIIKDVFGSYTLVAYPIAALVILGMVLSRKLD